jgi:outer membrane receptor for ferrienterochelin and colicin
MQLLLSRLCFTLLLAVFHLISFGQSQGKFTVSGYVKDGRTGESLIGTNVYLKELLKGASTNQYGFYSITVSQGNYTLVSSFLGYKDHQQFITLDRNLRVNIEMESAAFMTKEVVITGEREDKNVQAPQMGKVDLEVEKIKTLPAFMGEVDILKTIQLLPGVQSAGEGNAGYYVRGGGPDQNLILLDEAVVYNASHLFGFFSVFNADAVKNVSLIKGGMPAQYGGRLASVLDISMKEGNMKEYHAEGGLGFIASRLTIEGPIKKDTASFIISGRRTFIDLFLREPFVEEGSTAEQNGYFFYDLNTKINYRLSDKDRLYISGYFGRDVFKFKSEDTGFKARIPWGNATASARWNHLFNDRLFMNTTLVFTDYDFAFEAEAQQFEFKLFSGVRDWNGKIDFTYFPSILHNVRFGANYTYHTFSPSNVEARSGDTEFDLGDAIKLYSHEGAIYINDDWDISDRWAVSVGLRYTYFNQVGPFTRYVQNQFLENTDTITYKKGESVQKYQHIEPRFSVKFGINKTSSLKAGITQNYQYIHLASLSTTSLPTDVWVPSSTRVKPQEGWQYALGYFRNFKDNLWETSVEVYYKSMKNQVEYREGAQPDDDIRNNQDNNFVFGKGWSYGSEFFVKKTQGRFNGWVGYSLSWTWRQFPDLNNNKKFPAKYDRRHDVSIVLTYELNKKWTFGATWIYATGNALTLPQSRLFLNGPIDVSTLVSEETIPLQIYYGYGERNSYRQPAYHRLDISATLVVQKKKKWQSSWNFSIFNVYNRFNPYFIYFDDSVDPNTGQFKLQAKQVSLFPIIPSVTYNFKF